MSAIGWREHDNYILSWVVGESSNTIGKPRAKKTEEENGSTERTGKWSINYSCSYYPRDGERGTQRALQDGREAVLGCSSVRLHGRETKTLGFHMLKKKKKNQGKEKEKPVNETVKETTK